MTPTSTTPTTADRLRAPLSPNPNALPQSFQQEIVGGRVDVGGGGSDDFARAGRVASTTELPSSAQKLCPSSA